MAVNDPRIGNQGFNSSQRAATDAMQAIRDEEARLGQGAASKPGTDFGAAFANILNAAAGIAGTAGGGPAGKLMANAATGALGGVMGGGGAGGAGGAGFGGDASYQQLIQEQMRLQRESVVFQSISNTSKTEHDTRMNTVRNMRA